MVSAPLVDAMPQGSILINNARPDLVSVDAVSSIALDRRDIALAIDSTDIKHYFPNIEDVNRLLLTPHTAGISKTALQTMETTVIKQLLGTLSSSQ